MKKIMSFIMAVFIAMFCFGFANAQQLIIFPDRIDWPVDTLSSPTNFNHGWFFDVPEGVNPETVMLHVWTYSSDGLVDVDLSAFQCMKIGTKGDSSSYRISADSVIVKTAHTAETYTRYPVYGVADDTLTSSATASGYNGLNMSAFNMAYLIHIEGGGATNESDLQYTLMMTALKEE